VGDAICNNHTLEPFKELVLNSKKLASKLHVHSVKYAAKLVHTRPALSSTIINFHQEVISGQARNPPDSRWSCFLLMEEYYGTRNKSGSFSLTVVEIDFPLPAQVFLISSRN